MPVCGNQLFLECIHAVNAAFKATCYSVVCQPIYIGLDSAFTSQATGTRPEEHRDSHDRNAINLWPRLIFAKSSPSQPSVARTAIASYYFIFAHACLASDRVALWIIPLNAVATEPTQLFARSFHARETSRRNAHPTSHYANPVIGKSPRF